MGRLRARLDHLESDACDTMSDAQKLLAAAKALVEEVEAQGKGRWRDGTPVPFLGGAPDGTPRGVARGGREAVLGEHAMVVRRLGRLDPERCRFREPDPPLEDVLDLAG